MSDQQPANDPNRTSGPPVQIGPVAIKKSWFRRVTIGFLVIMAFPWLMAWISCSAHQGCNGCRHKPVDPVVVIHPIDASTRAIDNHVAIAETQAVQSIAQIEQKHAGVISQFDAQQRAEYEAVKAQGPQAVETWINAWYSQARGRP